MAAQQVKHWVADNIKWILTLVVIGISNYYILVNQISDTAKKLDNTVERVDKIEVWKEESQRIQAIKDDLSKKQIHELQLNLKSYMEKNGVKYISIIE